MSLDAMKQALEALEELNKLSIGENAICLPAEIDGAMDALRAAIKKAERPWQGLTEEEKSSLVEWAHPDIIDAIELKLRERNNG